MPGLRTCRGANGAAEDWFKVHALHGEGIRVVATAADPANNAASVTLSDGVGGLGFMDQDTSPERGAYGYLDADMDVFIRSSATSDATYALTVERVPGGFCVPDAAEPDDAEAAATSIAEPWRFRVGHRSACAGDVDHFRFTTPAGVTAVTLRIAYPTAQGALDGAVFLAGHPETVLSTVSAVTSGIDVTFPATAGTEYVLRVAHTGGGVGVSRYSIWPRNPEFCTPDSAEPNDTLAGAPLLPAVGPPLHLCAGDVDYFQLPPVTRPEPGRIRVTSTVESGGTALQLLTADGTPVAMTQDTTVTALWTDTTRVTTTWSFTAAVGAVHYVRAANAEAAGEAEYELGYSGPGLCAVTHPGGSLADPAPLGGNATLCEGETRFHTLPVTPPGPRSLVWGSIAAGVTVRIVDEGGTEVPSQQETGPWSIAVRYTSVETQPYFLEVRNGAAGAAGYMLEAHGAAPANDRCQDAAPLSGSQSVMGSTANADDDAQYYQRYAEPAPDVFYRVAVPAGATLQARLNGCADQSLWLVENCAAACTWAGVDENVAGTDEILVFTNTQTEAMVLLLAVDAQAASQRADFLLEVSVQ